MIAPYEECQDCVATAWCKRYSGESPKPESPTWCNPKFRLYKALSMSNIPKRYLNANTYHYKSDKENKHVASKLKSYLENILQEIEEGKNFLFFGKTPGTGKSFHGAMILNQYIYKACLTSRLDFENPLAYYIVYADLMNELRYNRDDLGTSRLVEIAKTVPVLMLDDVGAGTTTAFTDEQTYLIINHRYNNNLSTVFTTNLILPELNEKINARIVSRMLANCVDIHFDSKNDRRWL